MRLTRAPLWFSPIPFFLLYPFFCAHIRGAGIGSKTKFHSHVPSDLVRIKDRGVSRFREFQNLAWKILSHFSYSFPFPSTFDPSPLGPHTHCRLAFAPLRFGRHTFQKSRLPAKEKREKRGCVLHSCWNVEASAVEKVYWQRRDNVSASIWTSLRRGKVACWVPSSPFY